MNSFSQIGNPEIVRKLIHDGPIADIKIPKGARAGTVPGTGISFLQFARNVTGGCINVHAHGALAEMAGRTVTARCEVWMKEIAGRKFLYIDLQPTAGTLPTHELHVLQDFDPDEQEVTGAEHHFPTPKPLRGCIAFAKII